MSDSSGIVDIRQRPVKTAAVILSVDQREDTLRCLASLMASGPPSLGVIVVDNGSSDGTAEAIGREHPEVCVLRTGKNLGASTGRNVGSARALEVFDPTYLLFLDNDTETRPGFLRALLAPMEADSSVGQTAPKLLLQADPSRIDMAGGADIVWWRGATRGRGRGEEDHGQYDEPGPCVAGGCTLVRRTAFREVGGFDAVFDPYGYEDMDFSLRLQAAGWACRYVPQAEILHANSQTFERGRYTVAYATRKARNWLVFMLRHAPRPAIVAFLCLGVPWLAVRSVLRALSGRSSQVRIKPVPPGERRC